MLGQLVIFILEPLEPLMIYEVTLKKEITDLAGNAMEEDYSWEFSTTGDRLYLPAIIQ